MKVAISSRPYDGPWGGGNRFIGALSGALIQAGHIVRHGLHDNDIDIILIIDPRRHAPNACFGAGEIIRYLAFRNRRAIVVHRVNECDERKNEAFINHKLVRANYVADATVFVAEWLIGLPIWRENLRSPWFVIRNGSDRSIFNSDGFAPWDGKRPLKLVTHHWGYHPNKGFDVYAALDRMLGEEQWRDRLRFTYVGQLPRGFSFINASYVSPLDGTVLAAELCSHHAYLTASINEPGGNHQNEGALCGLPLVYRSSGCMPEYCKGFGIEFSGVDDLCRALQQLMATYPDLVERMAQYPWTAERMTREWIDLFEKLLRGREEIIAARRLWRSPMKAMINQVL